MHKPAHRLTGSGSSSLAADQVERWGEGWLLAGEIQQHSKATIGSRRDILRRLVWWCDQRGFAEVGTPELRGFLAYVSQPCPDGRWGNKQVTEASRPRTVHTYHGHLKTFFGWLVSESILAESPMDRIPVPVARADQIQPLDAEQVTRLILASKRSIFPKRNEVIIRMLYDTGLRASELCSILVSDLEMSERRVSVMGKGNKRRVVAFGSRTARALWAYVRDSAPDRVLLIGEHGPMTRSGLLQVCQRLGDEAGIANVHPHRLRHSFAIQFLRSGGDVFTLQQILGHTNLAMTQRYVAIAAADVVVQQRRHSPGDKL